MQYGGKKKVLFMTKEFGFMTDKRIKMSCPFCYTKADKIEIKIWNQNTKNGIIYCPNCGCSFTGTGKQNLIDKWNRR